MTRRSKCNYPCRIHNHRHFIAYLASCKQNRRCALVKTAGSDEIRSLSDLAYNLSANQQLRIKQRHLEELKKHKPRLLKLVTTRSISSRRKLLQHGGFLQALLVPLLATLATEAGQSLLRSLFKQNDGK